MTFLYCELDSDAKLVDIARFLADDSSSFSRRFEAVHRAMKAKLPRSTTLAMLDALPPLEDPIDRIVWGVYRKRMPGWHWPERKGNLTSQLQHG